MGKVITIGLGMGMIAVLLTGCGNDDERLVNIAAQSNRQQAEQNQAMARVTQEAAEGTKKVIEAEKESREKLLVLHQDLQTQRGQLETERQKMGDERRDLHNEQKQFAEEQRWESQLGPVLTTLGMMLLCSLPLVLCWKLLSGLSQDPQEDRITALLIQELITEPGPLRLVHEVRPALDDASASPDGGLLHDASDQHGG